MIAETKTANVMPKAHDKYRLLNVTAKEYIQNWCKKYYSKHHNCNLCKYSYGIDRNCIFSDCPDSWQ